MALRGVAAVALLAMLACMLPSPAALEYPFNELEVEYASQQFSFASNEDEFAELEQGSSAWCHGSNVNDRQCFFRNICFSLETEEYIFLFGNETFMEGVPHSRSEPALLTLSSVADHNVQYMNVIDLPASAVRNYSLRFITEPALLMRRFKPNNIMHVLHDDLLPLFHTLRQLDALDDGPSSSTRLVAFMDGWDREDYFDFATIVTGRPPLVRSDFGHAGLLCFRRAVAGLNKAPTWYDYGFFAAQRAIPAKNVSGTGVALFAAHVRQRFALPRSVESGWASGRLYRSKELGLSACTAVIFSRTRNRLILNEAALADALLSRCGCTTHVLSLETHTFKDMVRVLSVADVAVGLHGSILALAMFLPPGALLLELYPFAVPPDNYTPYRELALLPGLGLSYRYWVNIDPSRNVAHDERESEQGGIAHLPGEQQAEIRNSSTVPPHICCSDPFWLYRIYQDTLVDLEAITEIVNTGWDRSQVEGANCSVVLQPGKNDIFLVVSWRHVWNRAALPGVTYEVWLEEMVHFWETSNEDITLTGPDIKYGNTYTFWIRGVGPGKSHGLFSKKCVCAPQRPPQSDAP